MLFGCESRAAAQCNATMFLPGAINLKALDILILLSPAVINDGWWLLSVSQYNVSPSQWTEAVYWYIIYELSVSIFRLLFIDMHFKTLKLKTEDSSGRQHILTINLKSKVSHITAWMHATPKHTLFRCRLDHFHSENYSPSHSLLWSLMLTSSQSKSKQSDFIERTWDVQFADSKSVIFICAPKSRSNWRGCGETW